MDLYFHLTKTGRSWGWSNTVSTDTVKKKTHTHTHTQNQSEDYGNHGQAGTHQYANNLP